MKISIVVPVYNEASTVGVVLDRLATLDFEKEVIVVDDGSGDDTFRVAKEHGSNPIVERFEENRGKGAAVRRGFEIACGDIVVIQDADLELAPEAIAHLLPLLMAGEADAVYGSRFLTPGAPVPLVRLTANRFITILVNAFYGTRLTDAETAHKAIRRSLLVGLDLESKRFEIEIELTAKLARSGARFAEVPSNYQPRTKGDGKKIGWRDGLVAISTILRYLTWTPRP